VRAGRLVERIAARDVDPDAAARHHREQVVGHRLRRLVRRRVVAERRARHVEPLRRQRQDVHRRHRPRRIAEGGHQPERRQTLQRALPGVLADAVVDDLDAAAARYLADTRHDIFGAVVDRVRRAVLFRARAFVIAAGGCDHDQAERLRPLARDQPDAAGGGMPHDRIARMETALWERAPQQILHGESLEHHRGAVLEIDRVGKPHHFRGGNVSRLAVAAGAIRGVRDAITNREVCDAGAHHVDDARAFCPENARQRNWIEPVAMVGVDEVDAARTMANADLAGFRLGDVDLDDVQHVGPTRSVDLDRVCTHARQLNPRLQIEVRSLLVEMPSHR
jgi:hypothetical protein